jgi:hypothetical protein
VEGGGLFMVSGEGGGQGAAPFEGWLWLFEFVLSPVLLQPQIADAVTTNRRRIFFMVVHLLLMFSTPNRSQIQPQIWLLEYKGIIHAVFILLRIPPDFGRFCLGSYFPPQIARSIACVIANSHGVRDHFGGSAFSSSSSRK